LPKATIILGCWMTEMDPSRLEQLRDGAKADLAAASLGEALQMCITATGSESQVQTIKSDEIPAITAASFAS
jgi:hypothetical protein